MYAGRTARQDLLILAHSVTHRLDTERAGAVSTASVDGIHLLHPRGVGTHTAATTGEVVLIA